MLTSKKTHIDVQAQGRGNAPLFESGRSSRVKSLKDTINRALKQQGKLMRISLRNFSKQHLPTSLLTLTKNNAIEANNA